LSDQYTIRKPCTNHLFEFFVKITVDLGQFINGQGELLEHIFVPVFVEAAAHVNDLIQKLQMYVRHFVAFRIVDNLEDTFKVVEIEYPVRNMAQDNLIQ